MLLLSLNRKCYVYFSIGIFYTSPLWLILKVKDHDHADFYIRYNNLFGSYDPSLAVRQLLLWTLWWIVAVWNVAVMVCGRLVRRYGIWPLWCVTVIICDRYGIWPLWYVAVTVCYRYGMWPLWYVAIVVFDRYGMTVRACDRYGLWPLWYVTVMVRGRYGTWLLWYVAVIDCTWRPCLASVETHSLINYRPTLFQH